MKKFYIMLFMLAMFLFSTNAFAQPYVIQDCPVDIEVSATIDLCSAFINFDDPGCSGCLASGFYYEYVFSGATTGTTQNSSGQFNVGLSLVDVFLNAPGGIVVDHCQFSITVSDDQLPVPLCKDITVYLDAGGAQTIANDSIDDGSWDNCGITMTTSQIDFTCSDVGVVPVTLTVIDSGLNVEQCTANVTVMDTVNPNVSCVGSIDVYLDEFGDASLTAADVDNGSSDACSIDTMWLSKTDFDCSDVCMNSCMIPSFPVDAIVLKSATADPVMDPCQSIWLYVEDVNGNIDSCSTTVVVMDTVPPEAVCNDNITIDLDDTGSATITWDTIDNGSTDACSIEFWEIDITSFSCADACANIDGNIIDSTCATVTLTVTDVNCNSSTCTTTVTVRDNDVPDMICRDTIVYLDSDGNGELTADFEDPTIPFINNGSSDNCDIDTMWLDKYTFDCDSIWEIMGDITVTLTAMDIHGNTNSCPSLVTVKDTLAPTVECQAVTIYLNDEVDGYAKIVADGSDLMNTDLDNNNVLWDFDDNCSDDVTFMLSRDSFICADVCLGTDCSSVTLTATDEGGNTATCTSIITVQDSFPPHVITADDTLYLDVNGMAVLEPEDIDNESWDNCDIDTMWTDMDTFYCEDIGVHVVTLTAEDYNGNTASNTAEVTILDTMAPDVVCTPLTVYLYENGEYVLNENDIIDMSIGTTDNCTAYEDLIIEIEDKSFECIHVYNDSVVVVVSATDASGNTGTCETYVKVLDDIPPIMKCVEVVDIYLDASGDTRIYPMLLNDGNDIIQPEWARTYNHLAGGSYDACGIDSAWVSQPVINCGDIDTIEVDLIMADPSLNQSTCTSLVVVHDTFPPMIEAVADVELVVDPGVCVTTIDYPAVVVDDNCGAELELTDGLGVDGEFPLGTTTETWMATDDAGNTAMVSFNVVVTTTNGDPTIDAIDDVVADEDTEPLTVSLSGISYGADCEAQDVLVSATGTNAALITSVDVTYTMNDATGSIELTVAPDMSGTAEITVTVEDDELGTVSEVFMVTINPVNDPPFVEMPIADQSVIASFELKVPISSTLGDVFDDIDDDMLMFDIMTEDGSEIPAWATFMDDTLYCTPVITDTGCVNIIVKATDAAGASVSDTFEVCVLDYPVSIDEIGSNQFEVKMYPNPTQGKVNLDINAGIYDVNLSVIDITGKSIIRKKFSAAEKITFDMSGKVSGMYFVQLDLDGKQVIKKLVVK